MDLPPSHNNCGARYTDQVGLEHFCHTLLDIENRQVYQKGECNQEYYSKYWQDEFYGTEPSLHARMIDQSVQSHFVPSLKWTLFKVIMALEAPFTLGVRVMDFVIPDPMGSMMLSELNDSSSDLIKSPLLL